MSAEQLRDWAQRLRNGTPDEVMAIAAELNVVATELDGNESIMEGADEIGPGVFSYRSTPSFVSTALWPVDDYGGRWLVLGPADKLLDVEEVAVPRMDGTTGTVIPIRVVGWRKMRRKGGPVLYVLMTFERIVPRPDGHDETTPEWTLS
jgi:hypothetical protein